MLVFMCLKLGTIKKKSLQLVSFFMFLTNRKLCSLKKLLNELCVCVCTVTSEKKNKLHKKSLKISETRIILIFIVVSFLRKWFIFDKEF
jgi:hypothetical protein